MLSDHEQDALDGLSRALAEEDPRLRDVLRGTRMDSVSSRSFVLAWGTYSLSVITINYGVLTSHVTLGYLGLVTMMVSSLLGIRMLPNSKPHPHWRYRRMMRNMSHVDM